MGLNNPYRQKNYMGEYADDASVLTFIRANNWDSNGNGTGLPLEGMLYFNTTDDAIRLYANGVWVTMFSTNYVGSSNVQTGVSAITGTAIDWTIAQYHYKVITTDTTFTFSNDDNGYQITVIITASGDKFDSIFPAGIKWPGGAAPGQVANGRAIVYTFLKVNNIIYGTYIDNVY